MHSYTLIYSHLLTIKSSLARLCDIRPRRQQPPLWSCWPCDSPGASLALREDKGVLAIVVDAVPAERAEGAEDGRDGLAILLPLAVFDGGGTAEAAGAFDADD